MACLVPLPASPLPPPPSSSSSSASPSPLTLPLLQTATSHSIHTVIINSGVNNHTSKPKKPPSRPLVSSDHPHHHSQAKLSRRSPRSMLLRRLDSPTAWLVYYFAFNLGLTIYNKRVLISFPFPWTLTAIHTLSGTIGSQIALSQGIFTAARLSRKHTLILVAFSVLYTVNIAISNLSLHLVTVPFHQVVRATTPLFTIFLSIIYLRKSYPIETYFALMIVVSGVGLSTYGDYGWTLTGLILTLLGTILAALKTIVTNVMQVGRLRLNPLDLLMRMSPLAFIQCVVYAYGTGEMGRVRAYGTQQMDRNKALALFFNGLIAFGLNVVSFTANKKTSALTMTVSANVKQVLTILLAIFIFDLKISMMNFLGITITLIGGAYYAKIELERKQTSNPIEEISKTIGNNSHLNEGVSLIQHHHNKVSPTDQEFDWINKSDLDEKR